MDEPQPFAEWIGREGEYRDVIGERLVESYRALFSPHLAPVGDGEAPLGIHWCLSPSIAPMAALGNDGHPAKNRDMPPVPQPRRMWAGGSLKFLDRLRIGDCVRRVSTITAIERKQGRSGELWFVTVSHEHHTARGLAIGERQDIVYRQAGKPSEPGKPAESPPSQFWRIETTPTLLFRYSAISFNGHRIHYDHPYATAVEGYRGLVVHGPMQATLLLNLAAVTHGSIPAKFDYRGLSPAIAGDPLLVCAGEGGNFWTQGLDGVSHMEGHAAF